MVNEVSLSVISTSCHPVHEQIEFLEEALVYYGMIFASAFILIVGLELTGVI